MMRTEEDTFLYDKLDILFCNCLLKKIVYY